VLEKTKENVKKILQIGIIVGALVWSTSNALADNTLAGDRSWNEFLARTWVEFTQNYTMEQVRQICNNYSTLDSKLTQRWCANQILIIESQARTRENIAEANRILLEVKQEVNQ
jgi:hypothetical protein